MNEAYVQESRDYNSQLEQERAEEVHQYSNILPVDNQDDIGNTDNGQDLNTLLNEFDSLNSRIAEMENEIEVLASVSLSI